MKYADNDKGEMVFNCTFHYTFFMVTLVYTLDKFH